MLDDAHEPAARVDVQSHSSVALVPAEYPPDANAKLEVPTPPRLLLAVFISPISVQAEPFHSSFKAFKGGVPPKTIP